MNTNNDINKSNYENYVIDYIDGKLDAIDTAKFMLFLEENPDIKEDIADLNSITLVPEEKEFTQKSNLKKEPFFSISDISELNYEEYFIAFHEGDLSELEKTNLQYFLKKNPGLVAEFELFDGLKVVPDTDLVFKDKSLLQHKNRIVPLWFSSAAAVLVLFAAYWFLFNQQPDKLQHKFYAVNKIISKENNAILSQGIITRIELEERQLLEIKQEYNSYEFISHEENNISSLLSRINNEQLVNVYDFARLVKQKEIVITPSFVVEEELLASIEAVNNKDNRGLISKIFNGQKERLVNSIKFRRTNKTKSIEPTYIQVLDKGLLVFNTITGSETATAKTYNVVGELTSYQIEGQEVLLSRRSAEKSAQ